MQNKIIIPNNVKKQIDYLHSTYPEKEWSGILVYTVSEGNFYNLDSFNVEVKGIYPMDLGKAAYTEFEYEKALVDVYNIFESKDLPIEIIETGMIHSHHTMKAYFSSTDMDELKTNARKHNYYLSLVVNVDEEYAAKIAFPSKVDIKETHRILNKQGQSIEIPRERNSESLLTIDLDIEIEESSPLDSWFKERIKDLKTVPSKSWESRTRFYPSYPSREWRKPTTATLFPEIPASKQEDKAEDFFVDLISQLVNKQYHSLNRAIFDLASTQSIKGLFDNFDEVFVKTYIKHFNGKAGTSEELEDLVTNLIVLIETMDSDKIDRISKDDNCLDDLKDLLYEQIPE